MKINVLKLKTEVNKLSKLINEYEELFLNLYNNLTSSSTYWEDDNAKSFFENINLEKMQVSTAIDELNEVKDIYEFLITKYEEFGHIIEIIPANKNIILSNFDKYLDKLYDLIEDYHNLDLEFCSSETKLIYENMDKLIKIGNNTLELKEKIKCYYEKIETIEKTINLKISKLKIEYLNETDINNFI